MFNERNQELLILWQRVVVQSYLSDSYFESLLGKYDNEDRAYHNTEHLRHMMHGLKSLTALSTVNILACFYHDYIYVPGKKDNELRSAKVAEEQLTDLGFGKPLINDVMARINATKQHSDSLNNETNQFLDADMSILAISSKEYVDYQDKVKREYKSIPNFLYRHGRKRFLQKTINQDRIFFSKEGYDLWEKQARNNISNELKVL